LTNLFFIQCHQSSFPVLEYCLLAQCLKPYYTLGDLSVRKLTDFMNLAPVVPVTGLFERFF